MQIYLVGGAVRDSLLKRRVTERDYVVVGATADEMIKKGFTQVGRDFPVFLHPKTKEEYALARTERKKGQGYTGFICDFTADITLEEDLIRRDLTVNAIAQAPDGQLIDPYGGQADLNNRILRHVSDAFSEDPLRILRVARFAARYHYLGFTVAPETITLMKNMVNLGEIATLTPERVWIEWEKSLKEGAFPIFLSALKQTGALAAISPALDSFWNTDEEQYFMAKIQASQHAITPEQLFSAITCTLSTDEFTHLKQALKLPNCFSELTVLAHQFQSIFTAQLIKPEHVLSFFNGIDLWRKPERLDQLTSVFQLKTVTTSSHLEPLHAAAKSAGSVNAQTFIQQGITGAAIKPAMETARSNAIKCYF
ncbi:tRNA nucleotidyltransferase (CCA-adding enzyme) [Pseudoalteromonas ulvae UL12]|uniref:tRNA nucleotidyltransferase n=1 Tax=Pseudoalteromonas ulvae TaxID=107327 RepID=UPI00186B6625|nr:tRNA nucleotidyltransferase [Pseudoalteromonas ulvae]MBE0365207.1 tRNA nucleotidyltransferase (CCA-adding enzyme) [Pseudoalteromonas ulvae UL12]